MKKHYFLIKDFKTFMHDHKLHRGRKHFCRYCFKAFRNEVKLKFVIKDCFNFNGKQTVKSSKKLNILTSKIFKEK